MEAQVLNLKRCEHGIQHAADDHRAQRPAAFARPSKAQHQRPQEHASRPPKASRFSQMIISGGRQAASIIKTPSTSVIADMRFSFAHSFFCPAPLRDL
jgi:hypothetical protein